MPAHLATQADESEVNHAEHLSKHERIVELAEKLSAMMRTEPDKNVVLDAYSLAMSFWRR